MMFIGQGLYLIHIIQPLSMFKSMFIGFSCITVTLIICILKPRSKRKHVSFLGFFLSSGSLSMIIIKGYNKVVFEGCGKQNKGEDVNQKLSIFKKNIGGKHRQLRILLSACLRHPFLNFASISTLEDK